MWWLGKSKPVIKLEAILADPSDGKKRLELLIFAVSSEKTVGGEGHLLALSGSDLLNGGAVGGTFAVFNFGKVDIIGRGRN